MRNLRRSKKGQFSVISALLVSVILIMAVISMYSMVRYNSLNDSPKVLTGIGEMNNDIKRILDFTVGYYGSILRVTGNSTYAKQLTTSYLSSGLVNIARSHPEWNPSFELDFEQVSTGWFMPQSYSMGNLSVTYSLSALGLEGITYETSSALSVEMLEPLAPYEARINVTRDNSEPELGLTKNNFWFYNYSYSDSTWVLVNPTNVIIASNGVYTITIPDGINPDSYSVQVEDNRGIIVPAFYSQSSVADSKIPHYTYTFDWTSTGVTDIYDALETDTFALELLQNGTLKWLGKPLQVTPKGSPIPPVCIKAFRVNATIDGINQEVPFQVEDWASEYMVPLGLAGNDSIFSNTNMLVFLANDHVSDVTVWWDGNDTATQTPYAWQNRYFDDNPDFDPDYGVLNNGLVELNVNNFYIESATDGEATSCTVNFLRLNTRIPQYGDQLAYVIYNGVVRDIVQQEPEYQDGVENCPNVYTQVVLTFPANATYYTYSARVIFIDSSRSRTISDLSALQVSSEWVYDDLDSFTENGLSGGYPVVTETSGSIDLFYNSSSSEGWSHHWSEYIIGASGAGVMFTNSSNFDLYAFDDFALAKTGALNVTNEHRTWVPPTSVQSVCGEDGDHPASNAIDEDLETYWRHYYPDYHSIVFDMGETVPISRLRIYQQSDDWGGSAGIRIYVSDNPEVWGSPAWSGQIGGYGWVTSGSFSASGRYVKIVSLTNSRNQILYDVQVETLQQTRGTFEFNPVERYQVSGFYDAMDVTWYGAVVTFDDEPIYPTSGDVGLWVMVEHPPSVSLD